MGITAVDPVSVAATLPAKANTFEVTCDLDLQSVRDAVETILQAAARSGLGRAADVTLAPSIVTDVALKPIGIKLVATWIAIGAAANPLKSA